VTTEDIADLLAISAVYLPPRHTAKQEQLEDYYNTLAHRFIAGGDYNSKHTDWGSRLTSPRGRELNKTITSSNYKHISTGEPTYWPTDMNKLPDLVDFCVTKGIPQRFHGCTVMFRPLLRSFSYLSHALITSSST
jgi:hypothetical protein